MRTAAMAVRVVPHSSSNVSSVPSSTSGRSDMSRDFERERLLAGMACGVEYGFLTSLMSPDLHDSLTEVSLLSVSDRLLFQTLPLVMSVLEKIGETSANRTIFVKLVGALRLRASVSRPIKLRLMLLVRTPGYGSRWQVSMVFRHDCYPLARTQLEERLESLASTPTLRPVDAQSSASTVSGVAFQRGSSVATTSSGGGGLTTQSSVSSLVSELESSRTRLMKFAVEELLHPTKGVKQSVHKRHLLHVHDSFHASDVVDWLMERLGLANRSDAVRFGEAFRAQGVLRRVGKNPEKHFKDDAHLYVSQVSVLASDKQYACVVTKGGEKIACWREAPVPASEAPVVAVQMRLPVDMVDLQSVDFWGTDVYREGVDVKGFSFGYRTVTHPLLCNNASDVHDAGVHDSGGHAASAAASPCRAAQAAAMAKAVASASGNAAGTSADHGALPGSPGGSAVTAKSVALPLPQGGGAVAAAVATSSKPPPSPSTGSGAAGGTRVAHAFSRIPSMTGSDSVEPDEESNGVLVSHAEVVKVFSSIARPMIVQLSNPHPEARVRNMGVPTPQQIAEDKDAENPDLPSHEVASPDVIVKKGDNLLQDMSMEIMFRCFNSIWQRSERFPNPDTTPYAYCYEVIPTGPRVGFMEAVTSLESLRDFDWEKWATRIKAHPGAVENMVRSAAGAYVAAYVLGAADRHWHNILIKECSTMLHIDFGYILTQAPPIDGPRFSISPAMQAGLTAVGVWGKFVDYSVKAFLALRDSAPEVVRTTVLLFSHADFEENVIREYMKSKVSLAVHSTEEAAAKSIQTQIDASATQWKMKVKSYTHDKVDPAFYKLLEKRFPPALLAMKIVEAKNHATSKVSTVAHSSSDGTLQV
ncbi:hypothetical protein I4F81_004538 [Pyropia yezoensis]|uniref:Uncharacterized protein n=1 Tax=Pyropia yezoensis TaxID=2788 RepID=A0ACC3BVM4_PYRYE|nr:hypothetical protein I4F81_004538 [Neopyropia yezoensis]